MDEGGSFPQLQETLWNLIPKRQPLHEGASSRQLQHRYILQLSRAVFSRQKGSGADNRDLVWRSELFPAYCLPRNQQPDPPDSHRPHGGLVEVWKRWEEHEGVKRCFRKLRGMLGKTYKQIKRDYCWVDLEFCFVLKRQPKINAKHL